MHHIWCNQMHGGGYPACGYRSTREDLSSWTAYWHKPVGSLSAGERSGGFCPGGMFGSGSMGLSWLFTISNVFEWLLWLVLYLTKIKFVRIIMYNSSHTVT